MNPYKSIFQFVQAAGLILVAQVFTACGQTNSSHTINKTETNQEASVQQSEDDWKKQLTPDQYYILRKKGTEEPYSGRLLMNKEKGMYKCAACGNELFTDEMKFDSHCGWPSFDREIKGGKIKTLQDNTHGMQRLEIQCANCGGHLGHLFDDGPTKTGRRYCVNSLSLEFVNEKDVKKTPDAKVTSVDTLTLGGGCFWCVEAVYEMLEGVQKAESGYSGGAGANPSYKEVCTGTTGHAEVVQVIYDNTKTSLEEVLKVFFTVHDPTTLNRQGNDAGTQYRSVVFYRNEKQRQVTQAVIDLLNKEKVYSNPVVTQVAAFRAFYKAEDYHQDYFNLNKEEPYCQMVIQPKIEKFEKVFKEKIKK